ncbi:MAG: hypothetical protein ABI629_21720 [bacterium]
MRLSSADKRLMIQGFVYTGDAQRPKVRFNQLSEWLEKRYVAPAEAKCLELARQSSQREPANPIWLGPAPPAQNGRAADAEQACQRQQQSAGRQCRGWCSGGGCAHAGAARDVT